MSKKKSRPKIVKLRVNNKGKLFSREDKWVNLMPLSCQTSQTLCNREKHCATSSRMHMAKIGTHNETI